MSDKKAFDLARKYITERVQMVIATQGEHPWIATVYYSFDDDLNLYFLSNPETIHCKHITANPQVAVAIADSPQNPASKKMGIQIFGLAEQITSKNKIVHALKLWRNTLNVKSDAYTYEGMMKKLIKGRMYKITPKKMKFFNEEVWEEGDEPLIDL
ncbi:MAG: hypothetical protein COU63_00255 [Candidatus Pacebacteria bacterium CG10_big_fil_rev_8_21_14_0_10_36_11]|nr:pyridoxamine 5'-phosphate oxidase family protein [Candidatus Pacearchaeota archaeon]OIP74188.1 MAG: hypothetical protein AUK08_03005 [Candidatus Pacebacteria bacterium CG2_30_36_39]PIR65091.1 MAG: hypothetical protein COU63_00255 [Candidatus Pacebacteria bacterium CG10_big_fil_rev_8_21_14_0_10_36_11]PJC42409.1 MAG: hypothetical protein CO040_04575 [Candidatus Pacebacteria bacterium CG_4_9_14_0_2_um_filter_36_8]